MKRERHLLLRASAGTGKTYALTSRYLALLFDGADPSAILATTFTRKAAHEILERVLERLATAARDDAERARLGAAVGRSVSAQECLDLLARLLRGMERIRIATIDAVFAQLARLFALDIGLPPAWRIADEAEGDALRSEAVADAVANAGKVELLDLLRDLQRQSIGQSVHRALLDFTRRGREALLESRPEAWQKIEPLPGVEPSALARAITALANLPLPTSKSGKNPGSVKTNWAKSKSRLADCVAREDWSGVLVIGLVKSVCAGEAQYDRVAISPEQLEVLRPIVARALHEATTQLARQNRASRALLESHEESYRTLSRTLGLLDFNDLPEALAPLANDGNDESGADREFDLEHRLDGRIDHLLLDEFQDTAPVQWRVLRPIADGILKDSSGEKSFFCVGDVKQSIYGWRAAEPRLLRDLAKKRPALETESLSKSYRSSRAVLETVNLVFGNIAANPAFADGKGSEHTGRIAAAEEFQGLFTVHESASKRGEEPPGAVFLLRARANTEADTEQAPVFELAVERVYGILEDAPLASVGVLVRRRKWIPELIHKLSEAGIAASDEGGNPLTDSAAVLHALSMLHLADHPGDLAAAFHVATSPLGPRVGLVPAMFGTKGIAGARASEVAREVRRALAVSGIGTWLASMRPKEGEGYGAWDVGRFGQLIDQAMAWELHAGSRPTAFVERVRKTKVEDPASAQVRVMTVHGAKGLEFDAVVLPELDGSVLQREDRLLTLRPDPEGEIDVVTHGLPKAASAAHPRLERVRADVEKRRIVEALCVLYVAMTRAKHRLDLIVKAREKEGGGFSYAAILRGALGAEAVGKELIAWEHEEGTTPWYPKEIAEVRREASSGKERSVSSEQSGEAPHAPARSTSSGKPATEARASRFAPSKRPRSLPRLAPSSAHDVGSVSAASLLRPREAMTVRGRLMHRLLQEVEWIETFDRSDEELMAIGRRVHGEEAAVRAAVAEFRAALARPETRKALSKPDGDAQVWRERPFSVVMRDEVAGDSIWSGAFDRVVVWVEEGRVSKARVIDFKTDAVSGEALKQRADSYRGQMDAYRGALSAMIGLEPRQIEAQLLFLSADSAIGA